MVTRVDCGLSGKIRGDARPVRPVDNGLRGDNLGLSWLGYPDGLTVNVVLVNRLDPHATKS